MFNFQKNWTVETRSQLFMVFIQNVLWLVSSTTKQCMLINTSKCSCCTRRSHQSLLFWLDSNKNEVFSLIKCWFSISSGPNGKTIKSLINWSMTDWIWCRHHYIWWPHQNTLENSAIFLERETNKQWLVGSSIGRIGVRVRERFRIKEEWGGKTGNINEMLRFSSI